MNSSCTNLPHRALHCSNARREGAAYLEALVILPFLMIVWAGVFFMFDRYNAQQQVQLAARTCAWLWANQACEGSLPPQCNGVISDAGPVDETGETDRNVRNSVDSDPVKQAANNGDSFFDKMIGTILGSGFHANKKTTVELPGTLGKGNRSVGGAEYLICNEKERALMDVIKGAACVFNVPGAC